MAALTHDDFVSALTPKWRTLDEARERLRKIRERRTEITRFEAIPLAQEAVHFGFAQSRTQNGIVRYQITRKGQSLKNRIRRYKRKKIRRA